MFHYIDLSLAPCKRIRNPESSKFLLLESGIQRLKFGIHNGLESGIQRFGMESGIQKVVIQNPDAGIRNLDARFNYLCILFNVLEGAVSLSFSFTYSNLGRREMQSLQSRTSKRDIALCKRIHEAPEFRIPACPSCLSLPL